MIRRDTNRHPVAAQPSRSAYTLLELILALALSMVVILAIGAAIQLYMIALTKQQAMIERKQIARSILAMIANDLRAGLQYKATDYSDLENLVQSQLLAAGNAADAAGGGGGGEAADDGGSGGDEETDPVFDEELVSFRPTLLGTTNLILLDISRLPRLDQYNPLIATADAAVQTPSDVKSLAYFVSLTEGGMQSEVEYATPNAPGGLYRREIDRAVASYRGDTGLVSSPDEFTRLVAHEIAQVQFRFFDGESWLNDWDSAEQGGFPPAIEITLVIDPERTAAGTTYNYGGFNNQTMESYRSVVHLPAAEMPMEEEQ